MSDDLKKLPKIDAMDDVRRVVSESLARQREEIIEGAIDRHLGGGEWSLELAKKNLRCVYPCDMEYEEYVWGNTPLVRFYPFDFDLAHDEDFMSHKFDVSQNYKLFV